jgi:hypothetical protein
MTDQPWKGRTGFSGPCGAQYKIGMQIHPNTRCKLQAGHLGKHIAGSMLSWPRTNEELEELADKLDDRRASEGT